MDAIRVDKLTKKFNGFTAVDELSFDVRKGGIRAVLAKPESFPVPFNQKVEFAFRLVYDGNQPVS